jgi:hypothetical protein
MTLKLEVRRPLWSLTLTKVWSRNESGMYRASYCKKITLEMLTHHVFSSCYNMLNIFGVFEGRNHNGEVGQRSSFHEAQTTVLLWNASCHTRYMHFVLQHGRWRSRRVWLAHPHTTWDEKLKLFLLPTEKWTYCLQHPKSSTTWRAIVVLRLW